MSSASCPVRISRVSRQRREALWSVLHLSMEAAVEAEQLRLVSAGRLASEALTLSTRFYGPDFPGARASGDAQRAHSL